MINIKIKKFVSLFLIFSFSMSSVGVATPNEEWKGAPHTYSSHSSIATTAVSSSSSSHSWFAASSSILSSSSASSSSSSVGVMSNMPVKPVDNSVYFSHAGEFEGLIRPQYRAFSLENSIAFDKSNVLANSRLYLNVGRDNEAAPGLKFPNDGHLKNIIDFRKATRPDYPLDNVAFLLQRLFPSQDGINIIPNQLSMDDPVKNLTPVIVGAIINYIRDFYIHPPVDEAKYIEDLAFVIDRMMNPLYFNPPVKQEKQVVKGKKAAKMSEAEIQKQIADSKAKIAKARLEAEKKRNQSADKKPAQAVAEAVAPKQVSKAAASGSQKPKKVKKVKTQQEIEEENLRKQENDARFKRQSLPAHKPIADLAAAIVGALKDAKSKPDYYSSHFVHKALFAFALRKAESSEDKKVAMIEFYRAMPDIVVENFDAANLKDAFTQGQYKEVLEKVEERYTPDWELNDAGVMVNVNDAKADIVLSDREKLMLLCGIEEYNKLFPIQHFYSTAHYEGVSYSNCCESALLNALNVFLFDFANKVFRVELLKAIPNVDSKLVDFYENFKTEKDQQSKKGQLAWSYVVSGRDRVLDPDIYYKKANGTCEIMHGVMSVAGIIRALFPDAENQRIRDARNLTPLQRAESTIDHLVKLFSTADETWSWATDKEEAEEAPVIVEGAAAPAPVPAKPRITANKVKLLFSKKGANVPLIEAKPITDALLNWDINEEHFNASFNESGEMEFMEKYALSIFKPLTAGFISAISDLDMWAVQNYSILGLCEKMIENFEKKSKLAISDEDEGEDDIGSQAAAGSDESDAEEQDEEDIRTQEFMDYLGEDKAKEYAIRYMFNQKLQDPMVKTAIFYILISMGLEKFYHMAANLLEAMSLDDPFTAMSFLKNCIDEEGNLMGLPEGLHPRIYAKYDAIVHSLEDHKFLFDCLAINFDNKLTKFLMKKLPAGSLSRDEFMKVLEQFVEDEEVTDDILDTFFQRFGNVYFFGEDVIYIDAVRNFQEAAGNENVIKHLLNNNGNGDAVKVKLKVGADVDLKIHLRTDFEGFLKSFGAKKFVTKAEFIRALCNSVDLDEASQNLLDGFFKKPNMVYDRTARIMNMEAIRNYKENAESDDFVATIFKKGKKKAILYLAKIEVINKADLLKEHEKDGSISSHFTYMSATKKVPFILKTLGVTREDIEQFDADQYVIYNTGNIAKYLLYATEDNLLYLFANNLITKKDLFRKKYGVPANDNIFNHFASGLAFPRLKFLVEALGITREDLLEQNDGSLNSPMARVLLSPKIEVIEYLLSKGIITKEDFVKQNIGMGTPWIAVGRYIENNNIPVLTFLIDTIGLSRADLLDGNGKLPQLISSQFRLCELQTLQYLASKGLITKEDFMNGYPGENSPLRSYILQYNSEKIEFLVEKLGLNRADLMVREKQDDTNFLEEILSIAGVKVMTYLAGKDLITKEDFLHKHVYGVISLIAIHRYPHYSHHHELFRFLVDVMKLTRADLIALGNDFISPIFYSAEIGRIKLFMDIGLINKSDLFNNPIINRKVLELMHSALYTKQLPAVEHLVETLGLVRADIIAQLDEKSQNLFGTILRYANQEQMRWFIDKRLVVKSDFLSDYIFFDNRQKPIDYYMYSAPIGDLVFVAKLLGITREDLVNYSPNYINNVLFNDICWKNPDEMIEFIKTFNITKDDFVTRRDGHITIMTMHYMGERWYPRIRMVADILKIQESDLPDDGTRANIMSIIRDQSAGSAAGIPYV